MTCCCSSVGTPSIASRAACQSNGADGFELEASVAQDHDAVGEPLDLAEAVADEEDRQALVAQHPQDGEQAIRLRRRQRRRGLVEDQQARSGPQGAGEHEQLGVRGAETRGIRPQDLVGPRQAEPFERRASDALRLRPAHETVPPVAKSVSARLSATLSPGTMPSAIRWCTVSIPARRARAG